MYARVCCAAIAVKSIEFLQTFARINQRITEYFRIEGDF